MEDYSAAFAQWLRRQDGNYMLTALDSRSPLHFSAKSTSKALCRHAFAFLKSVMGN
jgi:hypothetical protein